MKDTKYVTLKDVLTVQGHAKDCLVRLPPRAMLISSKRPLTDGERLAVSYLEATLMMLGENGLDTSNILVHFDTASSEPTE